MQNATQKQHARQEVDVDWKCKAASGQIAELLGCEMMVYAASCMFQGPVASQPLIRYTVTGIDSAHDFG